MDAVTAHTAELLDSTTAKRSRLVNVDTLGVDEHILNHAGPQQNRAITSIVDLSRDAEGNVHARLLDVTLGRSGPVYAAWLRAQGGGIAEFIDGITYASLDPFRDTNGYANAIHSELPRRQSHRPGRLPHQRPRREDREHGDG